MTMPTLHQQINTTAFAQQAVRMGQKGGSVRSDRKKAAVTTNLQAARAARYQLQLEKGRIFSVEGTQFTGSNRACRDYRVKNGLKGAKVLPVVPATAGVAAETVETVDIQQG